MEMEINNRKEDKNQENFAWKENLGRGVQFVKLNCCHLQTNFCYQFQMYRMKRKPAVDRICVGIPPGEVKLSSIVNLM